MNTNTRRIFPEIFHELPGVMLVAVPPESWGLLRFPTYQRKPTAHKVRDIAKGLRDGYQPAPITLIHTGGAYLIVDGGHRFSAFRLNYESYGIAADIPALIYNQDAIDQNQMFVLENNKLRMNPTAIIRADNRHMCSEMVRMLGRSGLLDGTPFDGCANVADYPIRPLSIVKAALVLHAQGEDLWINTLAYYSVSRALDRLDAIISEDPGFWLNVLLPFLRYEFLLWGSAGRHLLNFGILGFAYFLSKNRARFFDKSGKSMTSVVATSSRRSPEILSIKTTRTHKSKSSGSREIKSDDRSDFGKLAALRDRWDKPGDLLRIEASRDPVRVAYEINLHFWYKKQKSERIWRPELSL